eukprot:COSAG02_NODE_113_length_35905_cov_25.229012_6_plen_76_part_00
MGKGGGKGRGCGASTEAAQQPAPQPMAVAPQVSSMGCANLSSVVLLGVAAPNSWLKKTVTYVTRNRSRSRSRCSR